MTILFKTLVAEFLLYTNMITNKIGDRTWDLELQSIALQIIDYPFGQSYIEGFL